MNIISEIETIKKQLQQPEYGENNLLFRLERIERFLSESLDYTIIKNDPRKRKRTL